MDVEKKKDEIIMLLRAVEDEAKTLIRRCGEARACLPFVRTESELLEYADRHDLEKGFKHIEMF